jgi:hypothetical protein
LFESVCYIVGLKEGFMKGFNYKLNFPPSVYYLVGFIFKPLTGEITGFTKPDGGLCPASTGRFI